MDAYTPYRTDTDGNPIDPPIIQSYERDIQDASAAGDTVLLESLTEDYHKRRAELCDRHNNRVSELRAADERLLAADRQSAAEARDKQAADAADQADRQRAAQLRRQEAAQAVQEATARAEADTPDPPAEGQFADDPRPPAAPDNDNGKQGES